MQARFIRNLLVLSMGLASAALTANAQNASRIYVEPDGWSLGMSVGESDLWGDVGTKSVVDHYTNSKYFDKMAFIGGLYGRYTVHPCFAIRLGINYGTLYATDKWNYDKAKNSATQGTDAYQRYARSQNVKDDLFEGTVLFEFTPRRINPESRLAGKRGQPYIAAGFTYFHFVPYSTVGNSPTYVKIHDLDLEGQGFPGDGYPKQYKLWQPAVPLCIGYRWDVGQHLNIGIEYTYHITFTDYLDGVSGKYVSPAAYKKYLSAHDALIAEEVADKGQFTGLSGTNAPGNMRGNAGNKDSYSTITINIYYKVHNNTRSWWK